MILFLERMIFLCYINIYEIAEERVIKSCILYEILVYIVAVKN